MRIKCIILHTFMDIFLLFLYIKGYLFGINFFNKLFVFHFWFTDILYGIFGIAYVIALTNLIKPLVFTLIKSIDLYALCNDDCNTIVGSLKGVCSKFKNTVAIVAFNKLIRECIKDISEHVEAGELTSEFFDAFSESLIFKTAKLLKSITVTSFDYIDECVLGYCYSHDEKLGKSAVIAISMFMKNVGDIGIKVFSMFVLEKTILILYDVFYIMWVIKLGNFTVLYLLNYYLLFHALRFIIKDAIFEPLLRDVVVLQFCKAVKKSETNEEREADVTVDDAQKAFSMEDVNDFVEDKLPDEIDTLLTSVPKLKDLLNFKGKGE